MSDLPDDAFADRLLTDMARLEALPYAEIGVPMFLIAEDCRGGPPPPVDAANRWPAVAAAFQRMGEVLDARRPGAGVGDVARLVEVLADRHLLDSALPESDDR